MHRVNKCGEARGEGGNQLVKSLQNYHLKICDMMLLISNRTEVNYDRFITWNTVQY